MRRLILLTAVITGLVGLAPVGAADSDTTEPTWTRVTDTDGRNIDEVGVARTKDGVLHVLWRKQAAPVTGGDPPHADQRDRRRRRDDHCDQRVRVGRESRGGRAARRQHAHLLRRPHPVGRRPQRRAERDRLGRWRVVARGR